MPRLDCPHDATGAPAKQVCSHLLETPDSDYIKVFGQGRAYFLTCTTCGKEEVIEAIPWRFVCDLCFAEIEAEGCCEGIRGTMQFQEEVSRLAFDHRLITEGVGSEFGSLRLVQPVSEAENGSIWVGLTTTRALIQMDLDTGTFRHITDVAPDEFNSDVHISLACSPKGDFLCLTQTLGDEGVVIETRTGRRTIRLQRDGYWSRASPFPATFVVWEGRTLLVHATAWNRLDVSDPSTGELLTERSPTTFKQGEQQPLHYLNYFHGRLFVSPDHRFIADDGWVWHPVGEVRTWSMLHWLSGNRWESEDGPTVRRLAYRDSFWGGPMCWIDTQTLAVWGYGDDDEWLLPAVRIFNVVSGEERNWFPGPEVVGKEEKKGLEGLDDFGGRLFFDRYLFAVSERFGVSVWSVERGTRLHLDSSFAPVAYHPKTKEFLTILPSGALQLSRLIGEE